MRRRTHERGVSVIEAAAMFSVTGTLLAVGVPAFFRELRLSHFVEPVQGLEQLEAAAIAYSHGRAASDAFPPSAPLTPATVPRATRAVDPPGAWDHPTWKALGFRGSPADSAHCFSFEFESASNAAGSNFLAQAHGDLNGDGVTSTFQIGGHFLTGEEAAVGDKEVSVLLREE